MHDFAQAIAILSSRSLSQSGALPLEAAVRSADARSISLGIHLCRSTVKKFSDNETSVSIGESVREEDVYIIQVSTSYSGPSSGCLLTFPADRFQSLTYR